MARKFSQSAWCPWKHLNNAWTHTFETAQKLWREPPEQGVDPGTREEANHAVRETQAVENHAAEMLNKLEKSDADVSKDKIRRIGDKAREIRQKMVKTGLPLPNDNPRPDSTERMEEALREIEDLRDELGDLAGVMSQEQMEDCIRCEEDLDQLRQKMEEFNSDLKTELLNHGDTNNTRQTDMSDDFFKNPEQNIPIRLKNTMADARTFKTAYAGAFAGKTVEEVADFVESEGVDLSVGPVDTSQMVNLGVGLLIPALELGAGGMVSNTIGSEATEAAAVASGLLVADTASELARNLMGRQTGGAQAATVQTKQKTNTKTKTQTSGGSGLVVGQGTEAEAQTQPGLVVG